jgi:phosphoribosylformylglycinamidine synthase I
MATPQALILRAPGTNCDEETAFAFTRAGARATSVHINSLREQPRLAADAQILCIPGGFSFGDDLGAGRILAAQIRHHLAALLQTYIEEGKLVLGICNGFQVLLQSEIFGSQRDGKQRPATLTLNDSGHFEDRWVQLQISSDKCTFLTGIESMYLPVAHAEGKFVARDETVMDEWDRRGQLVVRYAADGQSELVPYPANPNGSQRNVAGCCDDSGRAFGLMPHPERFIDRTQHPRWTREELPATGDGLRIFENAVAYFA